MTGVLHPLCVHLPIALLFMAFMTMGYWLVKGLATSVSRTGSTASRV